MLPVTFPSFPEDDSFYIYFLKTTITNIVSLKKTETFTSCNTPNRKGIFIYLVQFSVTKLLFLLRDCKTSPVLVFLLFWEESFWPHLQLNCNRINFRFSLLQGEPTSIFGTSSSSIFTCRACAHHPSHSLY